jgi:ABC-type multidrug transport system ATPase subunit
MSNAIQINNVTKRFGRTVAVDRLTLAVPEGSIYALLGRNGAGKSTTIKIALDLLRATAGTVRLFGVDSRHLGPCERQRIGYVSENQALPDWMTVDQLLRFCRSLYPTWDTSFCDRLLALFQLPRAQKLHTLSRGMRIKAALLSSLAYRPRLLVLDEPFTGIDVVIRDELVRGVLELAAEGAWTVVISSHDIDEVERLADWVAVIEEGRCEIVEPVVSLEARFRRIEITATDRTTVPTRPPVAWLGLERASHRITFVHCHFDPATTPSDVRRVFGDLRDMDVLPMSLSEVFLALGRHYRLAGRKLA